MPVRKEAATIQPGSPVTKNPLNQWNDGVDAHFA
jgi:hypothetical protein